MKKKSLTKLIMLLFLIFSLSVTVSASSDRYAIERTINNLMNYSRSYDTKKIKSLFTNPKKVKLFESNYGMRNTMKGINSDHLVHNMQSTKISGNTATVKINTWNYKMEDIWYESIRDCIYRYGGYDKNLATHVAGYAYGTYLSEQFFNTDTPLKKITVTLKMKKVNGKWKITNYPVSLNNAIHSCYQIAYNEYFY